MRRFVSFVAVFACGLWAATAASAANPTTLHVAYGDVMVKCDGASSCTKPCGSTSCDYKCKNSDDCTVTIKMTVSNSNGRAAPVNRATDVNK
jgi:hypothetical protein